MFQVQANDKRVKACLLFLLLTIPFFTKATHIIAGEITFRSLSYLTYEATVTIYTDAESGINTDTIRINWGDSSDEIVSRSNGTGEVLPNRILKSVYVSAPHTYAGPLPFFIISVLHFNRIDNIININNGASVLIPLFIEDTLRIFNPTFLGSNNSPVLLSLPIDYANVNDTFYHNPIAFDIDGDSLFFELRPPLQGGGTDVPNYRYPDEVPDDPFNQFTINSRTGEIIWATPKIQGIYNIAILVTEYRNGIKLGTVLRDMQIRVSNVNNNSPKISAIADTCVMAGSLLTKTVRAADANSGQLVTLSAEGGPLRLNESPASFTSPNPVGNPVSGVFNWQTVCEHIRPEFFQVVFKAQDNFTTPLVDLESWVIKVVAPAPENLSAQAQGNRINLAWTQPYLCSAFGNFTGFSVWRREGANPFPVDSCQTGLAGRGYEKIAEYILGYSYSDTEVVRGKLYCYRLLAEFAEKTQAGLYYNRVESLPSNEACAELKLDVPVMKHVSVAATNAANGEIFTSWYRPKVGANHLDTTQLTGPYSYRLYRSEGFTDSNPVMVTAFTSPFFAGLVDTVFTDTLLNTAGGAYSYKVAFYSNGGTRVGESESASSAYLRAQPASRRVVLSWEAEVPWRNFNYVVYRRNGQVFDSIAMVTQPAFTDRDLINNTEYCYYVKTIGEYSATALNDTMHNLSQQACATPVDMEAPCPPVLQVENPCTGGAQRDVCDTETELLNELKWQDDTAAICEQDIAFYNIYFAESSQSAWVKAGSADAAIFYHSSGTSLAGCYAVSAVDSSGNEGELSNSVCVANCPCYRLPNVFTPNNDGRNDYFTPIVPFRFVEKIDMQIYNRWGTLVFETTDPEIRWDGTDVNNGKPVKEGVYYYVCAVMDRGGESGSAASENILSGFIHVIRGKGSPN